MISPELEQERDRIVLIIYYDIMNTYNLAEPGVTLTYIYGYNVQRLRVMFGVTIGKEEDCESQNNGLNHVNMKAMRPTLG